MALPATRAIASSVATALPLAAALVLVFRSGGYYPTGFGTAAIVLLVAAAVAAIAIPRSTTSGPPLALWGLMGLSACQFVSAAHADDAALAHQAATLSALYAAAGGLTWFGMRRSWFPRLIDGALLVSVTAGLGGLLSRLFPSLGNDTETRLAWPLTYWNGLGAAAGFGLVLAVGVAGACHRSILARSATAATVPAMLLTLVMTFSRGGMLVVTVGTVIVVAFAPGRVETMAAILACAGPATVLVWLATRQDGLVQIAGELPPHAAAGHRIAVATICACLLAGGLAAAAAKIAASLSGRARQLIAVAFGSIAAVVVVVCLVVLAPARGYPHLVSRTAHDFTQPRPLSGSRTAAYLTASGTGRWALWNVAFDEWRSAPITGTGAGDFRFWWDQRRSADFEVVNAHSLYLETLAESGVVGVLLLLLLPVSFTIGIVSLRRDDAGAAILRDASVAIAACTGILAHAAFDWDWQLPAVILPALVLAFGVMSIGRPGDKQPSAWASAYAVPFVLLALFLASGVMSAVDIDRGKSSAARGDLPRALVLADAATRRDPGASEPRRLQANILADLGRYQASDIAFSAALARSPRNFVTYADWASVLLARGDEHAARILVKRGLALNPRDERTRLLARLVGLVSSP